jgi:hypothetical protein
MNRRILSFASVIFASTFALAGCDRLTGTTPAENQAQVVGSTTAVAEPPPQPPKLEWTWSQSVDARWSFGVAQPEVYWPSSGGIGLRTPVGAENVDVFVRSPKFERKGREFTKVIVDLECINPGNQNDLTIYYISDSHSESPEFRATPTNASPFQAGERRKLVYDMSRLARGGSDWVDSDIQRVRFDLPEGEGADYILHSFQLCQPDDSSCV